MEDQPINTCPICSQLQDVETSFAKYGAPESDRPLPAAAGQLVTVMTLDTTEPDKQHVRCCPVCAALYSYRFSYEYLVNGSEDEEELRRMPPDRAEEYCLVQARQLESLRQDIDGAQSMVGYLRDYIDRGRPSPDEERLALSTISEHDQAAHRLGEKLQAQVELLRRDCPKILTTWSAAHARVCQACLASQTKEGSDADTSRYVAQTTLEAWQQLPHQGETFISVSLVWLEGYLEQVERALAPVARAG